MKSDIVKNSSLYLNSQKLSDCDWVDWQKNATFVESLLNFDNGYCVRILHLDSGLGLAICINVYKYTLMQISSKCQ